MIEKGTWVQIHKIILNPEERPDTLPPDTKKVPLEMWCKGFLQNDAQIGDEVLIKTRTGRNETGTLVCKEPSYKHNYGDFVPELLKIDAIVKTVLYGADENE